MHARAFFAIGATFLAFASEGVQGLASTMIGKNETAAQIGILGVFIIAYVAIEIFGGQITPPTQNAAEHKPPRRRKVKRDKRGRFVKK